MEIEPEGLQEILDPRLLLSILVMEIIPVAVLSNSTNNIHPHPEELSSPSLFDWQQL